MCESVKLSECVYEIRFFLNDFIVILLFNLYKDKLNYMLRAFISTLKLGASVYLSGRTGHKVNLNSGKII